MPFQKPRHHMTRKERITADQDRIQRLADPINQLCAIANGEPVPVRDIDGNIIKYAQPEMQDRMAALLTLTKKLLPDLKSIEPEQADAGTTIVFQSPIPLPNSQPATLRLVRDAKDNE